jgi:hypothetical protein
VRAMGSRAPSSTSALSRMSLGGTTMSEGGFGEFPFRGSPEKSGNHLIVALFTSMDLRRGLTTSCLSEGAGPGPRTIRVQFAPCAPSGADIPRETRKQYPLKTWSRAIDWKSTEAQGDSWMRPSNPSVRMLASMEFRHDTETYTTLLIGECHL